MNKRILFIGLLLSTIGFTACKKEEAKKNEINFPVSFILEEPNFTVAAIDMVRRADGNFIILSHLPEANFTSPFLQIKEFEVNGSSLNPVLDSRLISLGFQSNLYGADIFFDKALNRTFYAFGSATGGDVSTNAISGSITSNLDINSFFFFYPYKVETSKIITSPNGFIIVGSKTTNNNRDVFVRGYNSNFVKVWEKSFGGSADDAGIDAVQLCDGNIGILAHTHSSGAGDRDVWFLKINPNGDLLSSNTYGGAGYEEPQQLVSDGKCRYYIAAHSSSFGHPEHNGYIVCIDDNGAKIWENNYGTPQHDGFNAITLLPNGKGLLAAGRSMQGTGSLEDIYVQAVDFSGKPLWHKIFGEGDKNENAVSVITDEQYYYLLCNRDQNEAVFVQDKLE